MKHDQRNLWFVPSMVGLGAVLFAASLGAAFKGFAGPAALLGLLAFPVTLFAGFVSGWGDDSP